MNISLRKLRSLNIIWSDLKTNNKFVKRNYGEGYTEKAAFNQSRVSRNLPLKVLRSGRMHIYFHEVGKTCGPITRFTLPLRRNVIVLNSPEVVYELFQPGHADGRPPPFFQHYIFQDKGFAFCDFTTVGEEQKKILTKSLEFKFDFSNSDSVQRDIRTFIESLCGTNADTNVDEHVKTFLNNDISRLLIGETIPEGDPDSHALWDLIDLLYTFLDPSIDAPLRALPVLRFLPGKFGNLFRNTIAARDRVAKRYFDSQKMTYKEGQVRGLVDLCLQIQQEEAREKGSSWLTDDYIKGLMYDTIAAGMSEMMKSIRMLILLMCHYPDVQSRVYAEINDVVGDGEISVSQHRTRMPYTEAVLMEMLRYVSQTPLAIPHKCNKDIILDGYVIEKDSGIFPNIWGIHHDENIWTDPWVFRPDRFLAEDGSLLPKDHKLRRTLIPFSVGKRRCPGEDFAMSRLFLLFATMTQRMKFCPPSTEELPSADPRLYTNKYPLHLPKFTCRAIPR